MRKLIITIFFCQCVTFANCQLSQVDSIKLSQQLEPYRKLLDSVAKELDAVSLLFLLQTKPKEKDKVKTDINNRSKNSTAWNFGDKEIKDNLPEARYNIAEIIPNDTNNILFIETEYDLPNRQYLIQLKSQYKKLSSKRDKINILLQYINNLNFYYPSESNWKFSKSNTLQKYRKLIESLWWPMPNDTLKSDIFVNYAETLENIDVSFWRTYIYSLYIEAKTILLSPYWKKLKEKNIPSYADTGYYKVFFKNHPFTIQRLITIYQGLYSMLSPENTFNINNELYPFEKKKNGYLSSARGLLLIAASIDKTKISELEDFENNLALTKSYQLITPTTIHSEYILADWKYLLENIFSKLLPLNKETVSENSKMYMYFGLANVFFQLRQYNYALNAYYKSLEIAISINEPIQEELFEMYFYQITSIIKTALVKRSDDRITFEIPNLCYLYELMSEQRDFKNTHHHPSIHAFKFINHNRKLFLRGMVDSSKKLLIGMKQLLIADTSSSSVNDYTVTLTYKELLENNWLETRHDASGYERTLDSAMTAHYKNQKSGYSLKFDENPDLIDQFNLFETVEINSRWSYQTKELNDEIKNKTSEIDKLNLERIRLFKGNEKLNQEINEKNEILNQATNRNIQLDSANSKLVNRNQQLVKESAALIKTISLQKEEVKFWAGLGVGGIIATILTSILVVSFIVKKKKKQIDYLNTEIHQLTQQKQTLEEETFNLKSILEANILTHKAELQSANDKILRELTVKHEIVGLITELYNGYENRFLNIKDAEANFKVELAEFGTRFQNLESFSRHYYKLLRSNEYNSVDDEIELCKKYVEVVKIRRNNFDVILEDLRSIKRNDIVLPHHILNNFSKNSIEKGKVAGKALKIIIEDKFINGEYCLSISDDGRGLPDNFSLNNLPDESTGFKNTLGQIDYYNSNLKLPYTIDFNDQSIINRAEFENISGVSVNLKFKLKANAIYN